MRIKLIDFGLSNRYHEGTLLRTFCGSPQYASPELVRRRAYVGPEVDCWSLGILLFFMVTGRVPFTGGSYGELYNRIVEAHYTLPSDVSEKCADLIGRMIVSDWRQRATITEICTHPWILDLKGFVVPVENRRDSSRPKRPEELNSEVIARMKVLGYDEKEVIESVLKEKYDELCSTYHLIQDRLEAASQRTTRSESTSHKPSKHSGNPEKTARKEGKREHRHHHKHHHHKHHHRHRHDDKEKDTKSHGVCEAVNANKTETEEPETDSQGQDSSPMTNRTLEQKDEETVSVSPLSPPPAGGVAAASAAASASASAATTTTKEKPTSRKEEHKEPQHDHFRGTYHEELYQSHGGQSSQSSATNSENTLSSSDEDDSTESDSDGSSSSLSSKDGSPKKVNKHFFFGSPQKSRHNTHRTRTVKCGTPSLTPCVTESTPIQLPVTEPCTPISPAGLSLLFPIPCTQNVPGITRSSTGTNVAGTSLSAQEQKGTHLIHVSIGSDSLSSSPLSHLCDAEEVSSQEDMLLPEEEPAFMFSTNHMHSSEAHQTGTGHNKSHNHRKDMAFATPLAMHMRSPQVPIKHSPLIPTCPDVPVSEPVTPKRDHGHPMFLASADARGVAASNTKSTIRTPSSHTPSPGLVVTKPHHSPGRRHGFTGTPLTIPSYMCSGTSGTAASTRSSKTTPVPRDGPNLYPEPRRPNTAHLPLTPKTQAGTQTPETSSGPTNATPLLCEERDDWETLNSPTLPRFMLAHETEDDHRHTTTPGASADASRKEDTQEKPENPGSTTKKDKKTSSQKKKRPGWMPLEPEQSSFCNSPAVDLLAPYTPTSPHGSRTQPVPRRSGSGFMSRPGEAYPRSGSSHTLRESRQYSPSSSSPSTPDKKKRAKEPRTTRFAFNVSLTSNKPANVIVDTVARVVHRHRELSVVMNDAFLMTVTHPAQNIEFQIEVCKIRFLSLRGVRFHRIRGDSQRYQEIVRSISSEIPKL